MSKSSSSSSLSSSSPTLKRLSGYGFLLLLALQFGIQPVLNEQFLPEQLYKTQINAEVIGGVTALSQGKKAIKNHLLENSRNVRFRTKGKNSNKINELDDYTLFGADSFFQFQKMSFLEFYQKQYATRNRSKQEERNKVSDKVDSFKGNNHDDNDDDDDKNNERKNLTKFHSDHILNLLKEEAYDSDRTWK